MTGYIPISFCLISRLRRGARPEEGGVEEGALTGKNAGKNSEQNEKVEEERKRGEGKAAEGLAQTDRDSPPSDQRPCLLLVQLDGPVVAKRHRAVDDVVDGANDDEPPPPPPYDAIPASLRYAAPAASNDGRRHESVSLRYAAPAAALWNGCPLHGRPTDDGRPDDGATADVGATTTTAAATAADDGGATGGGAARAGEIGGGEEGKGKTRSR